MSAELAREREEPYFRYGDRLLLEGAIESPPVLEEFDYPAFLARQGIGSVMSFPTAVLLAEGEGSLFQRWLSGVRRSIARSVAMAVPEPQASIGQALLLGMRDNIPEELVESFRVTGTSHLLAISGLHIGILLGISLSISARAVGRRRQRYLLAPLVLIWLYALVAGMTPSVAREAIMGSVYLAALALGRHRSVLPALGLAAAVMVALDPRVLWSVSFQLSFAAMGGIAALAEPIGYWLKSRLGVEPAPGTAAMSVRPLMVDIVAMTVAATVATLPLVAFYFERVSLIGLPATVLTLPALLPVLVTQALAGLVGLVAPAAAVPLGWLAWVATAYLTGIVGLLARLPGASFDTAPIAPLLVWGYYGLFALWYSQRWARSTVSRALGGLLARAAAPSFPDMRVPWWALITVVSVAILVWIAALSKPDGRLHVVFDDVGQGDAALITTPSGQHILVDGGPDPAVAARLLGSRLPFWDRTVDLVVLTHPHADHVTGLTEVLRRYDVKLVLEREIDHQSPPLAAWREELAEEGAVVSQAWAGQMITVGDGVFAHVLWPPQTQSTEAPSDLNSASVVLRLTYGDVSFLLTGDLLSEGEAGLLALGAAIDSEVLKVAHHGSRSSSSGVFLQAVSPVAAVISSGEGNRFSHPDPETVDALLGHVDEALLFMTSERGSVEFVTDGRRLEVKTER